MKDLFFDLYRILNKIDDKLTIKMWSTDDRPREKMLAKGIQTLSNAELIAILIGSGSREQSAVDLSKEILNKSNNDLNELGKYSVEDFQKIKGIGPAKAISIMAALELGKRRSASEVIDKKIIKTSSDIHQIFQAILCDLKHEEFWILLVNRSNRIIDKAKISQGGISETTIDVRLILKNAIEKTASGIALCHNHPSGNLNPSEQDKNITSKLISAAKLLDIIVIDHVIVTDNGYFSFADEGILM